MRLRRPLVRAVCKDRPVERIGSLREALKLIDLLIVWYTEVIWQVGHRLHLAQDGAQLDGFLLRNFVTTDDNDALELLLLHLGVELFFGELREIIDLIGLP